jgi:Tol biopolymer transport system component
MATIPPPESWPELAALVDALLDAPPERRPSLTEELSGGDAARRSWLQRLWEECEHESALLSRPAAERFAALLDDDEAGFPESLATRYHLTGELGRGGMATVYLARDLKHGREVAVKVVHPAVATLLGPERFLREIEIAAQLRHPHVVPLYDSGEADGRLYYVMPFEAGMSLRQRLALEGSLSPNEAVVVLREVCDALAHAHERGIIHCDIKPDNVLLSGHHALLTDFGVAKAATDATARDPAGASAIPLGTPGYMAPEQIACDSEIDHRADIYAVGVLAYEVLAGRPPFTGDTRQEILSAQLSRTPVPLASYRPDLPAALAGLVMKCLEKRPADRCQTAAELVEHLDEIASGPSTRAPFPWSRQRRMRAAVAAAGILGLAVTAVVAGRRNAGPAESLRDRWSDARVERLTDFPGSEVDAAISPDGRLVAFLADRDNGFDAFVGRVGSGQFLNLTGGRLPQLFNEDVRNIGFSPDAAQVWIRVADITSPASVSLIAAMGGSRRPFLRTAVMAVWSPDGSRLAFHESTPGDPIYLADADGRNSRRLFVADPGIHSHYLSWSPDGRFLFFAHGVPPNEMDVWRIPAHGGKPERITHQNSRVAYPVLLDDRTLLYTATADDGTGPWLYAMDLKTRVANRLSTGVEHYLSIAAAAGTPREPRRLVATVSNPSVQLWTVPILKGIAGEHTASRIALPTARAAAPRLSPDSALFYLASRGGADGIWRLAGGRASELWKPTQGAIVGAVAISPDGKRVCFPVRRKGRSTLQCTRAESAQAWTPAESLDVRGAASWSPDGKWIAVGAMDGAGVRVFKVPADGGRPVRLVDSVSSNPVWSPDGRFILYSGTPRARSVPLKAVTPDGRPFPLPPLLVDRVGDSYRFLPGRGQLAVKLGGFRRQDFWLFDLGTGQRRQLTRLTPGESLLRFDVSPDGKRVVFERVRENSDVVLIELPRR